MERRSSRSRRWRDRASNRINATSPKSRTKKSRGGCERRCAPRSPPLLGGGNLYSYIESVRMRCSGGGRPNALSGADSHIPMSKGVGHQFDICLSTNVASPPPLSTRAYRALKPAIAQCPPPLWLAPDTKPHLVAKVGSLDSPYGMGPQQHSLDCLPARAPIGA
jgi:hypothetical protein